MPNSPFQSQPKKPSQGRLNDSILESLRTLGMGVGKTVARDVVGQGSADALASLFGSTPKQGELKQNQTLELGQERAPVASFRRPEFRPRMPVVHAEEIGLKQKIEAVRGELKALSASIKNYNTEAQKAIESIPADPGVYHLNFLERLRGVLVILRQQIEDSRSWLALQTNRKKKQMGYWGLYKKHGTKFGLSSERTIATQAG